MVTRGVLYLAVAALALGVAMHGDSSEPADSRGAIAAASHQPGGRLIVLALALGLLAYAGWRIAEAVVARGKPLSSLANVGRAILYFGLFSVTLPFLTNSREHAEEGSKERDFTDIALDLPGGRWIVIAVGIGVIGSGLYQGWKGLAGTFQEKFERREMSARQMKMVRVLGLIGHAARMVMFGLIGWFLLRAGLAQNSQEAVGIDGALDRLRAHGWSVVFFVVMAAGLACFGLYSFAEARWRGVVNAD